MINRIVTYFQSFDYPVSAKSFALFRVLYAVYTIGLITQLYTHWPFYFDHIPPYSTTHFPIKLSLFIWLLSSLFLLAGWFTRAAAIVNYVLVLMMTTFFVNGNISSFNDDLMRIGGFLLIILPVSRSGSVDALTSSLQLRNRPTQVSYLYYLFAILLSIGLLYLASGVTKIFSPMWQQGLGLWTPAVLPISKWTSFDFFVDQQWVMMGLNYFVMLFELVFVFLLFNKRFHLALVITGIGMHLGIAFLFPFTYISFGPIFYYCLFIPDRWWNKLDSAITVRNKIVVMYNPDKAHHYHAIQLLKAFDFRNRLETHPGDYNTFGCEGQIGWNAVRRASSDSLSHLPLYWLSSSIAFQNIAAYISEEWLSNPVPVFQPNLSQYRLKRFAFFVFVAGLCGVQALIFVYHAYSTLKADPHQVVQYLKQRSARQEFSLKPANLARTFFGINSRGVFLDKSFKETKTVFTIAKLNADGTEEWLPIFSKEGYCIGFNKNLAWHKLSFRYFALTPELPDTTGLKKYTALWAKENHIAPHNLHFRVYRRIYPCPQTYEVGYLNRLLAMPWDTAGLIDWNDTLFHYTSLLPDSASKN